MKKLLLTALFAAFSQSALASQIVCTMTGGTAEIDSMATWEAPNNVTMVHLEQTTLPNAGGTPAGSTASPPVAVIQPAASPPVAVNYKIQTTLTGSAASVNCVVSQ